MLQHRQSLFPNSFLQICPLNCSKVCFNKCNWDFNPSWAGSSCNLHGVAISAAWSSLSGSSSLWQSKCGMDGRREGANRLVVLSETVKRGLVTLWLWLMLKMIPSFPVSHHHRMLGLCWAEGLSSQQQQQPGQQPQPSVSHCGRDLVEKHWCSLCDNQCMDHDSCSWGSSTAWCKASTRRHFGASHYVTSTNCLLKEKKPVLSICLFQSFSQD